MSAREFRPKRWEQKANVRPGKRARMYRYTQYDVDLSYDRGVLRGTRDTVQRHEIRDMVERAYLKDPDRMNQLAEACELDGEAGKEALERLAREWGVFPEGDDDLLDVADAAGVLSDEEDKALWDSVPGFGEGMVIEIEQWLRDRGRWLDFLRDHGELPDEG